MPRRRSKNNQPKKKYSEIIADNEETNPQRQVEMKGWNPIQLAKQAIIRLNDQGTYYNPIFREKEKEEIEGFLVKGITDQKSTNVSGLSGIGKTLTVRAVVNKLKADPEYRRKFDSWYINAMNLRKPADIYKVLLSQIFKTSHNDTYFKLNSLLTKQDQQQKKTRVVIIDEFDELLTKDEEIIYSLFEWTHNVNSRLVLIVIANTMDLPATLSNKVISRMGHQRLTFKAYSRQQISSIIQKKLVQTDIFDIDSLRFACMKISKFSTDIRKVVHLISQVLKIFINQNKCQMVQNQHVKQAFDQVVKYRPQNMYISTMPKNNQLILIMIMIEMKYVGKLHCLLSKVAERLSTYDKNLTLQKIIRVAKQFEEVKILKVSQKAINGQMQVQVFCLVDIDDIKFAIDDSDFQSLLNQF